MSAPRRVAVIDLGSNSLKFLVAESNEEQGITALKEGFAEVRLLETHSSATSSPDEISTAQLPAATHAVENFLDTIRRFAPQKIEIVGTSVFRSAKNAEEFSNVIFYETGLRVRVLSGADEALAIARGISTDPLVREESSRAGKPATIFDLGGGSLEFIADDATPFVHSFPIGAVRLTQKFIHEPSAPIPAENLSEIREYVHSSVSKLIRKHFCSGSPIVISGGVAAITRRIFAPKHKISVARLQTLLDEMSCISSKERVQKFPGLPVARADIFPAALAVFVELAELCGIREFLISNRNLRFGIASELLFPR